MKKTILLTTAIIFTSCSPIPKQAYFDRGQPESLLETAGENITVDINTRQGLDQLSDIARSKTASSATLECANQLLCDKAEDILASNGIAYDRQRVGAGNTVTFMSEEVVARDCESRYITNHNNPYALNHPTFGCSIAVNQVQMVSDKRQFTDPLLLGPYDGQKAAQNYDSYLSRDNGASAELSTQSATSAGSQ